MHVVTFEGSEPPDEGTPQRVLERLGSLADTATDERVRYAAEFLYDGLQRYVESH